MKPYIIIFCLLLSSCITKEYADYIAERTKINEENIKTVQADLQTHFSQDHQSDRKVTELKDQPDAPKLENNFIIKVIRFVATVGGSVHPAIGIGANWLLGALPFIFGIKEEDE